MKYALNILLTLIIISTKSTFRMQNWIIWILCNYKWFILNFKSSGNIFFIALKITEEDFHNVKLYKKRYIISIVVIITIMDVKGIKKEVEIINLIKKV